MQNEIEILKDILKEATETEDSICYVTSADADALKAAIKALEQQPCEDCISRKAVLRLVEQYPNIIGNRCVGLMADIKHLPSVTPSIPKGEWLHVYKSGIACECSSCHKQMPITEDYHFCPNCGADMRGGNNDD